MLGWQLSTKEANTKHVRRMGLYTFHAGVGSTDTGESPIRYHVPYVANLVNGSAAGFLSGVQERLDSDWREQDLRPSFAASAQAPDAGTRTSDLDHARCRAPSRCIDRLPM